jgi:DNA-binding beta-propeller fold protein YncE
VYTRDRSGQLTPVASYPTGGRGKGAGLGSQGAVVLSPGGSLLFAVNAGSNDVSMFLARGRELTLIDRIASGGEQPISVTYRRGLLYVLNSPNLSGFVVERWGLRPLEGSTQPLDASAAPVQIAFDPSGTLLVVTEKAGNAIVTFQVAENGRAGPGLAHPSAGTTPFGFAFPHEHIGPFSRERLIVSDAFGGAPNASAVSSYSLFGSGRIETKTAIAPTTQTAACWVVTTANGRYAYTSNTGSGSVSGFAIGRDGTLAPLNGDGRTGVTGDGSSPIDMAIAGDFLYAVDSGTHRISGFRVGSDGGLSPIAGTDGLPDAAVGLAAR